MSRRHPEPPPSAPIFSGLRRVCAIFGSGTWTRITLILLATMCVTGCGEGPIDHDAKVPLAKRVTPPDPNAPPGQLHEGAFHQLLATEIDGFARRPGTISPHMGQVVYEREEGDSSALVVSVVLRACATKHESTEASYDKESTANTSPANRLQAKLEDVRARLPKVHRDSPGLQWGVSPVLFESEPREGEEAAKYNGVLHWVRSYVGPSDAKPGTSARRSSLLAYNYLYANDINGIDIVVSRRTSKAPISADELKASLDEATATQIAKRVFRAYAHVFAPPPPRK